jgi:hypothetical protein
MGVVDTFGLGNPNQIKFSFYSNMTGIFANPILFLTTTDAPQPTEVGRAPLIHLKKIKIKKGFYISKLARELKLYAWIIIEGSKSLKKGQKMLKKATNLV